jgi:hypothetical protein
MRELASSDELLDRVKTILGNPDHPHFIAAWKFVVEQGYGKAAQTHVLQGDEAAPLMVVVVDE